MMAVQTKHQADTAEAVGRLNISYRQAKRLYRAYRNKVDAGLVYGNHGGEPVRFDGSRHNQFEGRWGKRRLTNMVDGANGSALPALFERRPQRRRWCY
jgi:hypothetical protein